MRMRETANQAPKGRKTTAGTCQPPANKIYISHLHKKNALTSQDIKAFTAPQKRCYIRILFYLKRPIQYLLHIFGEVRHLQFVFLRCDVVGSVGGEDGAGMLHNHLAAVAH